MLIVLNISFCALSMPIVILQIVYMKILESGNKANNLSPTLPVALSVVSNSTSVDSSSPTSMSPLDFKLDLIKAIAELLQYLNHSTNFFLYSLSGKTFRNETKSFMKFYYEKIKSRCAPGAANLSSHSHSSSISNNNSNHNRELNREASIKIDRLNKNMVTKKNVTKIDSRRLEI